MSSEQNTQSGPKLFLPSRRAGFVLAGLSIAALSIALFVRYGVIQNSVIGVACESGEVSLTCKIRLAVILMFIQDLFGWVAIITAGVQLWRPKTVAFGTSLIFALLGLVPVNTCASRVSVALLLLRRAGAVRELR